MPIDRIDDGIAGDPNTGIWAVCANNDQAVNEEGDRRA